MFFRGGDVEKTKRSSFSSRFERGCGGSRSTLVKRLWNEFELTDELEAVDVEFVEKMLRASYWAADRPIQAIKESIEKSVNFSAFFGGNQVGYARVVSDYVTFAWIADVVVDPDFQGKGIGKWLMECVLEHPAVRDTTQKVLRTLDAHGLYARFGFKVAECMTKKESH
jgi:GNAT superfamily N-acetyltransferase